LAFSDSGLVLSQCLSMLLGILLATKHSKMNGTLSLVYRF